MLGVDGEGVGVWEKIKAPLVRKHLQKAVIKTNQKRKGSGSVALWVFNSLKEYQGCHLEQ